MARRREACRPNRRRAVTAAGSYLDFSKWSWRSSIAGRRVKTCRSLSPERVAAPATQVYGKTVPKLSRGTSIKPDILIGHVMCVK